MAALALMAIILITVTMDIHRHYCNCAGRIVAFLARSPVEPPSPAGLVDVLEGALGSYAEGLRATWTMSAAASRYR